MSTPSAIKAKSVAAFTLLELLVVLGIIVVLAGIAFPMVQSSLAASRRAQCVANLKNWASVIQRYAADNHNQIHWYPNNDKIDAPWNSKDNANPYVKYFSANPAEAQKMIGLSRSCPAHRVVVGSDPTEPENGYAFIRPSSATPSGAPGTSWTDGDKKIRMHSLSKPSQFLLMTDCWHRPPGGADGWVEAGRSKPGGIDLKIKPICDGSYGQKVRHGGKVNVLFADFHVGSHTFQDFVDNENTWMVIK
jgi:prepilin-type processing-associated H-X9-DG protein/prepilin-type N-terminal cleavage/methylation domain-containing protein